MIDKPKRAIDVIASELQSALRRETVTIIDIGNLLLEAKDQLGHGEWLPWLKANFGSSIRSAQNYMNAARFAFKNAMVAHLNLKPPVLYLLGGDTIPLDEKAAILKVAETEWVDLERAEEIINSIHFERLRPGDTPEEIADREQRAEQMQREQAARHHAVEAERSEIDDILDGPPPELPGGGEPAPTDLTLKEFDEAISTLLRLNTKPLSSFAGTAHDVGKLNTVALFMREVASHLRSQ